MKEDQIGYIAVSEFDSVTYHQFETALEDLEKQGMKGLVMIFVITPAEILIQ